MLNNRDSCTVRVSGTYDVVDREYTSATFELAPPPIFVSTIDNFNHISFVKRKLAGLCRLEGVQSTNTSNNRDCSLCGLLGRGWDLGSRSDSGRDYRCGCANR